MAKIDHEGHEEFARERERRNRLSHNCNLAVVALLSIAANSYLAYESCGAVSARK
jgi:hypothetical protein